MKADSVAQATALWRRFEHWPVDMRESEVKTMLDALRGTSVSPTRSHAVRGSNRQGVDGAPRGGVGPKDQTRVTRRHFFGNPHVVPPRDATAAFPRRQVTARISDERTASSRRGLQKIRNSRPVEDEPAIGMEHVSALRLKKCAGRFSIAPPPARRRHPPGWCLQRLLHPSACAPPRFAPRAARYRR